MREILIAKNISKSFGTTQVLDNISFSVMENEIFGIIGADGAGKSTLFRILTTLSLPNSGSFSINGLDYKDSYSKIREIIGYMPGNFSLYLDLSIKENLAFFASIFNVDLEENFYLIEPIYKALAPFENRKARDLSGGMKQKLALCVSLIHKPKILFLDEPTGGVDAISRMEFWEILKELKSQMSIIVSTPYMNEASMCDRVALISQGRFLSLASPRKICKSFAYKLYKISNLSYIYLNTLQNLPEIRTCYLFGDSYHITLNIDLDSNFIAKLSHILQVQELEISEIEASIEDCFMEFLKC